MLNNILIYNFIMNVAFKKNIFIRAAAYREISRYPGLPVRF